MNRNTIIILSVVGVIVLLLGVVACDVIVFNNRCVAAEKGIQAQYTQNQNNYDNYFKKLKEAVQIPEMYSDDLLELYQKAITARYGEEGSDAMFQWLREHNPTLDASVYKKVQDIIEAGRNSFEADQKMLIDKKRAYETSLETFPHSMIAPMLGFPKINLDDYGIVTSDETEKVFKTGKSDPIQLR
jgi:hypothetical protein